MVNEQLESSTRIPPPHKYERAASTHVPIVVTTNDYPIMETSPLHPPLQYLDVYVDDFIKLAQGWLNCLRVRRCTFHAINNVIRPNDNSDSIRKEPISQSKLTKGDDKWSTLKTILGWIVDTQAMTISLPDHRKERLLTLLKTACQAKQMPVQDWHQLLGELCSMALAIPGSAGCFSHLQFALKPHARTINITKPVRNPLQDFLWLAKSITSCPTHLAEVVPTPPSYHGAVDAAKAGMGGVWFTPMTMPILSPSNHLELTILLLHDYGENLFLHTSNLKLCHLTISQAKSPIVTWN